MWFNQYPYINVNDLNLDYLLKAVSDLRYRLENFININTIKYANPIQWNITTQYEANTVVIDPNTGTAYLSVKPVPSGVALSNTEYWTEIFTLDLISANQNITLRNDGNNVLATFDSVIGDWLIWNGILYRVIRDIETNSAYVVGYNVERYTVESFLRDYINNVLTIIGDLDDLDTTDKTSIVNAINNVISIIGNLNDLTTTDKSDLVNAINEMNATLKIARGTWICPEDFGAVGDGVADDTAALQAMFDYMFVRDGVNMVAEFQHNYNVTHIEISANTNQTIHANGFIIKGISDNSEESVVTIHPNNAEYYDLTVSAMHKDNYYCAVKIAPKVVDGVVTIPASYSTFYSMEVQGAIIGLLIGEEMGATSTSAQVSENTFVAFKDYSCMIPVYINQLGGYLNFVGGVFSANRGEWVVTYPSNRYDANSSCCLRCDVGEVIITGAEFVKADFSTGAGVWGRGIQITACDWEVAAQFILATGDVDIDTINNGFNGGNQPLISAAANTIGQCTIRNLIIRTVANVSNFVAYCPDAPFYKVVLENVYIVGRPYDSRFLYRCDFDLRNVNYLPNGHWGEEMQNANSYGAGAIQFLNSRRAVDNPRNCSDVTVGGNITKAKFTMSNVSGSTGSVIAQAVNTPNSTTITNSYRISSNNGDNIMVYTVDAFEGDVFSISALIANLTLGNVSVLVKYRDISDNVTSSVLLETATTADANFHRYNEFLKVPAGTYSMLICFEVDHAIVQITDLNILKYN